MFIHRIACIAKGMCELILPLNKSSIYSTKSKKQHKSKLNQVTARTVSLNSLQLHTVPETFLEEG